ncbi:MAG: hypothetical protein LUG18_02145 [Candidatus Azobacteroides sp.]|nr:hypothetical protein [Candidatus Azobacteroides sp.]
MRTRFGRLLVAMLMAIPLFVSCDENDNNAGAAIITFDNNDITVSNGILSKAITGSIKAPYGEKIDAIEMYVVYNYNGQETSALLAEKKDLTEVKNSNQNEYTFRFTETNTVVSRYLDNIIGIVVVASIKNGDTTTKTLLIKHSSVTPPATTDTPLSSPQAFTITYKNSSQAVADRTAMEITWTRNAEDAVTANFSTDGVILTKYEYDNITTQNELKDAYNAGKKVTSFSAQSDSKFSEMYMIVNDYSTLRLVRFIKLEFSPGNNKAYFNERH